MTSDAFSGSAVNSAVYCFHFVRRNTGVIHWTQWQTYRCAHIIALERPERSLVQMNQDVMTDFLDSVNKR